MNTAILRKPRKQRKVYPSVRVPSSLPTGAEIAMAGSGACPHRGVESASQTLGAASLSDAYDRHLPAVTLGEDECFDNDRSYYARLGHTSQDHCNMYRPSKVHLRRTEHVPLPENPGVRGCCNDHASEHGLGDSMHKTLSEAQGLGSTLNRAAKNVNHRTVLSFREQLKQTAPSSMEVQARAQEYALDLLREREEHVAAIKKRSDELDKEVNVKNARLAREREADKDERTFLENTAEQMMNDRLRQFYARRRAERAEMLASQKKLEKKAAAANAARRAERNRVTREIAEDKQQLAAERAALAERKRCAFVDAKNALIELESRKREGVEEERLREREAADRVKLELEADLTRARAEQCGRNEDCYKKSKMQDVGKALLEAEKTAREAEFVNTSAAEEEEREAKKKAIMRERERAAAAEIKKLVADEAERRRRMREDELEKEREVVRREKNHDEAIGDRECTRRGNARSKFNSDLVEQMHYNTEKWLHEAAMH